MLKHEEEEKKLKKKKKRVLFKIIFIYFEIKLL